MNRPGKQIVSLLLILTLALGLMPAQAADTAPTEMQSGDLSVEKPSIADIQQKYTTVTTAETRFDEEPSAAAPYALGKLSQSFLNSGVTYLNYIRYLAGLPEVELTDEENTAAQYGAVLMAANDSMTHEPEQPEDMDEAFYTAGYAATSTSNLYMYGTSSADSSLLHVLQSAVSGQMADSSTDNMSRVGHRRWLLNPTLLYVGFGCADAAYDGSFYTTYVDISVFDRSGDAVDYDFIAWPVSGYMPVQEFSVNDPWSISLNESKYATPSLEDLTVTLTRVAGEKSFVFTSESSSSTPSKSDAYFSLNTDGIANAIIFRPPAGFFGSTQFGLGDYIVTVTGLRDHSGNDATLSYRVSFFDMTIGSSNQDISTCNIYMSSDGEDWVYEGLTCDDDGTATAKEPLVMVYCNAALLTQDVDYTIAYENNIEQGIAYIIVTGIGQYNGVKRIPFEIVDPTHTHDFGAPGPADFHWSADYSTCQVALTCSICGNVQMRECTVTYEIINPATCTERGLAKATASVQYGNRTYSYPRYPSLNALGHKTELKNAKAATCTTAGYTGDEVCTVCGETVQTGAAIPALGHKWDAGKVTMEPTETVNGVRTYTCARCGETKTEIIPALNHTHSYIATVTAPTCTERGYTTYTCTSCGDTYVDSYVDALGHKWDAGKVTTAPTETTDGVKTYTCTVCGETRTEAIPATGEQPIDPVKPIDPTTVFTDVSHDWAYPGIEYCYNHGLMAGMTNTTFEPNSALTRGQFVAILWRQLGCPAPQGANPFTDLTMDYYRDAITWAAENKVVYGTSETTFEPDCAITRQDLTTMFYRYVGEYLKQDVSGAADIRTFPDYSSVADYAQAAMAWAKGVGLITGNEIGSTIYLDPLGAATRAQAATMFMNLCEKVLK